MNGDLDSWEAESQNFYRLCEDCGENPATTYSALFQIVMCDDCAEAMREDLIRETQENHNEQA